MFKLKSIKNQKISSTSMVQILFYTLPLAFVAGNLFVSTQSVLFVCFSLYLIIKNKLPIRFEGLILLPFIFFAYFFILTTIQFKFPGLIWGPFSESIKEFYNKDFNIPGWYESAGNPFYKSFLLIRFLLLIFVIDILFFNNILKLKKFLSVVFFITTFVSLDILLQYFTGTDLFGMEKIGSWSSGPFGDEKIASSFLQSFSLFSFFYIYDLLKNKKLSNAIFVGIVVLHLIATVFGGNRMPTVLLFFGCLLTILFVSQLRYLMSASLIIFLIFFSVIVKNDNYFKSSYGNFLSDINIIKLFKSNKNEISDENKTLNKKSSEEKVSDDKKDLQSKDIKLLRNSHHNRVFTTAFIIWKESPLTGFGYKSYRLKCIEQLIKNQKTDLHEKITCSNHPHNYYLEILTESGVVGLSLILLFFIMLLKKSFYYCKKNSRIFFLFPMIIIFFLEIWPLKSTGSFFTTWSATFLWLNVGLLITHISKKK